MYELRYFLIECLQIQPFIQLHLVQLAANSVQAVIMAHGFWFQA